MERTYCRVLPRRSIPPSSTESTVLPFSTASSILPPSVDCALGSSIRLSNTLGTRGGIIIVPYGSDRVGTEISPLEPQIIRREVPSPVEELGDLRGERIVKRDGVDGFRVGLDERGGIGLGDGSLGHLSADVFRESFNAASDLLDDPG